MAAKSLSFAAISGAVDTIEKTIDVPEWGGPVTLRSLTVADRNAIGTHVEKHPDVEQWCLIVGRSIVDGETGERLTIEQSGALMQKNADVMARIATEALSLSSLGKEGLDEAKKDSEPAA